MLLTTAGCGKNNEAATDAAAVPVTVSPVKQLTLPAKAMPGRIEAWRSAEVRARVAGIVLKRHFEEGSDVKKGQLLFTIDPAPFAAELAERKAQAAKAQALVIEADAELKRAEQLVGSGAISQQAVDSARAEAASANAELQAAQAAVKTAQLQLDYADVTAPISGRIGRALVTEGALVGQGETTPLALIQQIDRVYANFNQPVAQSLHWSNQQRVALNLSAEGSSETFTGQLLFADISVDPQSGQVNLRGEFANPERKLLPGMYVRVTPQQHSAPALFVPSRAVHHDHDKRAFVWLVGADNKAEQRFVSLGAVNGQDWEIIEGISATDVVITGGKVEANTALALPNTASK